MGVVGMRVELSLRLFRGWDWGGGRREGCAVEGSGARFPALSAPPPRSLARGGFGGAAACRCCLETAGSAPPTPPSVFFFWGGGGRLLGLHAQNNPRKVRPPIIIRDNVRPSCEY